MDPVKQIYEKTNLALKITNALGYNMPPPFLFGKSAVVDPEFNKGDFDYDKERRKSLEENVRYRHSRGGRTQSQKTARYDKSVGNLPRGRLYLFPSPRLPVHTDESP